MHSFWKRLLTIMLSAALMTGLFGCQLFGQNPGISAPDLSAESPVSAQAQAMHNTYREGFLTYPHCWSPFQGLSGEEQTILNQTSMGLYAVAPSNEHAQSLFMPEMAQSAPVDVTELYKGLYGVPQDAKSGYAFQIDLHPDACWQDGTPIDASTYLYSMEQLLAHKWKNPRASQFFSGQIVIANAWNFYMQDQAGENVFHTLAELGYSSVTEAGNDGLQDFYLNMLEFWGIPAGWKRLESEQLFRDTQVKEGAAEDFVSPRYLYETYLADGMPYEAYQTQFVGVFEKQIPELSFQEVGFLKTGKYQITVVLEKPAAASVLQANLLSGFLVHPALFDTWGANYGTSVESYSSCGPYRLDELHSDVIRLTKNSAWYGFHDGNHQNQFRAAAVRYEIYSDPDAVREAFEKGLLDTMTADYPVSGGWVQPLTYLSKLTFNTSLPALQSRQSPGINKTILANEKFRRGFSLAIDRQAFAEACVPGETPALGLLSHAFIWNLDTGESYRDTPAGQSVLSQLYGAADASGYDAQQAGNLMQEAYQQLLTQGEIQPGDIVELEFLVFGEDAVYENITAFLQNALNEASKGTDLEQRIRIVKTVNPSYYEAAKAGTFEMILSTWGGNAWDPWGVMRGYCDAKELFEYGFDPSSEQCMISLNGQESSMSYRWWYEELVNRHYADAPEQIRCQILAGLEYRLLEEMRCIPLYERNRITLDGPRIQRSLTQMLPFVGLDGLRYVNLQTEDAQGYRNG